MSINLDDSIASLVLALAGTIEDIEPYLNPFIMEQDTAPRQSDWELAWLAAGNSLPISEDQELYWKAGDIVRGQFGRTNDRFYCIFPSNSVTLAGVTHFAYTKFLGWEDEQHFLFSGTQLNDSGQYTGLLRAYLDGSIEQVDFTGFTANTLLGYDEAQGKLWYIEGTALKRIDTTTEVITTIATGITVAPTSIAFDGAGDAFCTINIGAGLDVYRWNNGAATFTSFKASITVNGAGQDPGQVITASLNYVVVLTSVSNYWVQIARAGGAETQIKSNPAGATSDNLPQPNATAWVQTFAGRSLNILSIVFTELTGTPGIAEWRKTYLWNMATATYTEELSLPYDDFIAMCIAEAPNPDPLNYDARRDIVYHSLTSAYRKRVSNAWEYHNISGVRNNNSDSRKILETDDGQVFVWSNGSSGKIWRLSAWDQGEADALLLAVIPLAGVRYLPTIYNFDEIPAGYDIVEVIFDPALADGGAVAISTSNLWYEDQSSLTGINRTDGIYVDINTWLQPATAALRIPNNSTQGSIILATFIQDFGGLPDNIILEKQSDNTGIANETVSASIRARFIGKSTNPSFGDIGFSLTPAQLTETIGGYVIVRALRTESRRQGGAYYDPAMA